MRSTVLVVKNAGSSIDDDTLQKVIETHGTSAGVMVAVDGELITESCDPNEEGALDLIDWVRQTEKVFTKSTCYFSFSNADVDKGEFSAESVQPWTLLVEGEGDSAVPKLAVIADGEFNDTYEAGSDTAEYSFVLNYLAEKMGSMLKSHGGDYKKLWKAMSDPKLREDLMEHCNPRGCVLMLSDTGTAWGFDVNKLGITMTWGGLTKSLGLTSDVVPVEDKAAPVVAKKKLSIAERAAAAANGIPPDSPPGETVLPGKDDRSPNDGKPPLELPVPDNIGHTKTGALWVSIPQGLDHKAIIAFWNRHSALTRPKEDSKLLEGFSAAQLKKDSPFYAFCNQPSTAIKAALEKAKAKKVTGPKPLGAQAAVDGKPAPSTGIGLIPAESRKNILEMAKTDKNLIHDPAAIVESSKDIPRFSEQVAMDIFEIARWRPEAYQRLDKPSLVNLANELRLKLIELAPKSFEKKVEEVKEEVVAEAPPKKKLSIAERAALATKAA